MVAQGEPAPDFALTAQDGRKVRLSALRGRPVVLYFYPKDQTPGCTREACAFRDARPGLESAGAVVLGVSADSIESHAGFADKHALSFGLLSDPGRAVAKLYGAYGEKTLYGRKVVGPIRSTFVIDAAGIVRRVFPKVRVDGHAQRVLEALAAL